jgi:anti-sigma factor RsiW
MSIHENTGAYLLNALPEHERAEFEAHLAGCDACRREVHQLSVAADSLPVAVEELTPPPALKDRIMATVRTEAELLAAAGPAADRPTPAPPRRARGWFGWRPTPALAAALTCVLALGVSAGLLA